MPDTALLLTEDNAMGEEVDQLVLDLLERAKALATKALPDPPSNADVMELFHRICALVDMAPAADENDYEDRSYTLH